MGSFLQKNDEISNDLIQKLSRKPNKLDEYLELRNYLIGEQLEDDIQKMCDELDYCENLYEAIEEFFIVFDE